MTEKNKPPTSQASADYSGVDMQHREEWGLPNWLDPSSYGMVQYWTLDHWRWEFYRRREDLREFFDRWANINLEEGLKENNGLKPCERGFLAFGREEEADKEIKEFGYAGVPNPRIGEQPTLSIIPHARWQNYKRFYDPAMRKPDSRGVLEALDMQTAKEYRVWLEANEMAIQFNLDEPLKPQLDKALRTLQEKQKEIHGKIVKVSSHKDKWLGYLRTLDARAEGAFWIDIATIHPTTAQTAQTGRDKWNQANALRFKF